MKCILSVLIILQLVYDTAHAPTGGLQCQKRYCSSCKINNVVCGVPSLENITEFLNFGQNIAPINTLTLKTCHNGLTEPNLNIEILEVNCSKIESYHLYLFKQWSPHLKKIRNIYNDEIYTRIKVSENKTCKEICSSSTFKNVSSICICVNSRPAQTQNNGDYSSTTIPPSYLLNNQTNDNNTSDTKVLGEKNKYHFHYLLIIGCISMVTLLVNFILSTTVCCTHNASLIDTFGLALMVFNILLSLYGVALAVYLSHNHTSWNQQFCQGFTSVKLFALGASVWTMLMITFHRSVRGTIEEEREAIFKGLVYILEGLMLSGVLAVMSWIKLDKWDYLCIIFEPKTPVDWLLTGIELLYYFIAFCLVVRYPIHQLRKKKKTEGKKIDKNHPIFLMIFVCFTFWVVGYVITLPKYNMFTDKLARVIRVSCLIFPLCLQPIFYMIRNTCCCLCRDPPCTRKKRKEKEKLSGDHTVLLVCNCTGNQTCPACESDYGEKYGNTQFYGKEANGGVKKKSDENKNTKEDKKKKKKRKNKIAEPKAIERSPILKQKEISFENAVAETPLLEKDEDNDEPIPEKISPPTKLNLSTDCTPLLDDTDSVKQPPKATPDGTPVKTVRKQDSLATVNSPSEFPSFINMDSAVDVDALPKEKKRNSSHLVANKVTLEDEFGRKSRGPTFFPLSEKKNNTVEEKPKKKFKKKSSNGGNHKNSADHNKSEKPNHEAPTKRRKKTKHKDKEAGENNKTPTHAVSRSSTISLEWDHYSDSSGSASRESECFPDDLVVNPTATSTTPPSSNDAPAKIPTHQNNGVSRNDPKPGDKKSEHMEWDPCGVQEKESPKENNKEAGANNIDVINNSKNKQNCEIIKKTSLTNGKISTAPL